MGTAFKMLLALIPVFTSVLLITSSNAVRPPATAAAADTVSEVLEDAITVEVENNLESLDQKAAPWWEQQEEAAKRKCQSSCTMHSKGVKSPQISLCDDTDVSFQTPLHQKRYYFLHFSKIVNACLKSPLFINILCKSPEI